MNICFATSECVPFVKTGGLADVSGALPRALARLGCTIKVFLPLYESIRPEEHGLVFARELHNLAVQIGDRTVHFNTWYGRLPDSDVEAYLIDCPGYYYRSFPYTSDPDEDERFLLLQHAVMRILQYHHWAPDVLHANDWQTALLPVFLRRTYAWDQLFNGTASLLSIHNIAYQGRFDRSSLYRAGLRDDLFYPEGPYELYGSFSFLKAGLVFADLLTTVSRTYALEIQTPDFGEGLHGLLRARHNTLHGILNGIDTTVWNPAVDPYLPQPYSAETLDLKARNKEALLAEMNLPFQPDCPVIGIVSRFAGQKGFDLLMPILDRIFEHHDVQFVVLGSGEYRFETFFYHAAQRHPERLGLYLGYNERLSHLIEAGSDYFLMPSYYEPCGLNQMYSLTYGTIPIVHHTGGLADTVRDFHTFEHKGNGFSFVETTPEGLYETIERALSVYRDPKAWSRLRAQAMRVDFSWDVSARQYMVLYEEAVRTRRS